MKLFYHIDTGSIYMGRAEISNKHKELVIGDPVFITEPTTIFGQYNDFDIPSNKMYIGTPDGLEVRRIEHVKYGMSTHGLFVASKSHNTISYSSSINIDDSRFYIVKIGDKVKPNGVDVTLIVDSFDYAKKIIKTKNKKGIKSDWDCRDLEFVSQEKSDPVLYDGVFVSCVSNGNIKFIPKSKANLTEHKILEIGNKLRLKNGLYTGKIHSFDFKDKTIRLIISDSLTVNYRCDQLVIASTTDQRIQAIIDNQKDSAIQAGDVIIPLSALHYILTNNVDTKDFLERLYKRYTFTDNEGGVYALSKRLSNHLIDNVIVPVGYKDDKSN